MGSANGDVGWMVMVDGEIPFTVLESILTTCSYNVSPVFCLISFSSTLVASPLYSHVVESKQIIDFPLFTRVCGSGGAADGSLRPEPPTVVSARWTCLVLLQELYNGGEPWRPSRPQKPPRNVVRTKSSQMNLYIVIILFLFFSFFSHLHKPL